MTERLDLDSAREQMLAELTPLAGRQRLGLAAADGRVLAEPIRAPMALPPFANAAMDGYAVRSSDLHQPRDDGLEIVDTAWAGHPAQAAVGPGQTIRIFTGAALPAGADMVVAQEDAETVSSSRVWLHAEPNPGRFVRGVGTDIRTHALLVDAGTLLHARHLALLAAAGVAEVPVTEQVRVTLISTGDELREPGTELGPGEIYDANRPALTSLLRRWPVTIVRSVHVRDDPETLRGVFDEAAQSSDAIICSGGVSVGDADHVRAIVGQRGRLAFWRLALKPGRPFTFGYYGEAAFFGLPGNPVSSLVTALLLVRPALWRLAGSEDRALRLPARLAEAVHKTPGRRDFQRGQWLRGEDGQLLVRPLAGQDSNMLGDLSRADCLIDLPQDSGDLAAGAAVEVMPLAELT